MLKYVIFAAMFLNVIYAQNGISKKVYTDKSVYTYGEKVTITIRAINSTLVDYTLTLPDPCHPYPFVDSLNYLKVFGIGCAAVLVPHKILANDSIEWIREYPHHFEPNKYMPVGKHKIYGYFRSNLSTTDTIEIEVKDMSNSLERNPTTKGYSLFNNYPNPFNPSTTISFNLNQPSFVSVVITDVLGIELQRFIDKPLTTGVHSLQWDPKNISSGIYFCNLFVNGRRDVRKLVYIR